MTFADVVKPFSLTRRQTEVCRAIFDFQLEHGYGPTVRELGDRLGILSPNGVRCHTRALAKKGVLVDDPLTARSLKFARIKWIPVPA